MSYQRIIVSGQLARDPEIRHTANGAMVCTITIPTTETWRDKSGEKQERAEWHKIILWNKTAELAEKYLQKGSAVTIEGKVQTRKWQDKDGADRYSTEIKADSMTFMRVSAAQSSGAARDDDGFDDDVPF